MCLKEEQLRAGTTVLGPEFKRPVGWNADDSNSGGTPRKGMFAPKEGQRWQTMREVQRGISGENIF